MFQQMIYRVCSAARRQLRASGQDIIVSGENASAERTCHCRHCRTGGNTRDGLSEI